MATSVKRSLIEKANMSMVVTIAVTSAIVVFSLVLTQKLISIRSYRTKVIAAKKVAADTLKSNEATSQKLIDSFKQFDSAQESVIGTPEKNSKVVLDALPSKYDFPALASSLEKILYDGGYTVNGIGGTDEELTSQQEASGVPQPIEIPFSVSISDPYPKAQQLILDLQRSIRPIRIDSIDISGSDATLNINLQATTYYQPGKNFDIPLVEVAR